MQVTVKLTDHTRVLARPGTVTLSMTGDKLKIEVDGGSDLVLSYDELDAAMEAIRYEFRANRR